MRAVAGTILLAALAAGCGGAPAGETESEAVVRVQVEPATRRDVVGVVSASGLVAPAPGADLVVIAPDAARIAEMPHAAGERIRRGDLLVRFEVPASAADVQRQQAEVARARAALDQARAASTRAADLFERGVAARREVEEAQRAVAEADAGIGQALAALEAARSVAARTTVRAPFDGVVAVRQHNPGDVVEASASDPVLRVIDPRRMEIVAAVPPADVGRIRVGAAARLIDTAPGGAGVALSVAALPALVDSGTGTAPIRLASRPPITLPVGTAVQVAIEAERHTGVVAVPRTAVVREGDGTAVFVAHDGKAARRAVRTGLSDGGYVEIVSGVAEGESVIVDGQAGLPDGAAVQVTRREALR